MIRNDWNPSASWKSAENICALTYLEKITINLKVVWQSWSCVSGATCGPKNTHTSSHYSTIHRGKERKQDETAWNSVFLGDMAGDSKSYWVLTGPGPPKAVQSEESDGPSSPGLDTERYVARIQMKNMID